MKLFHYDTIDSTNLEARRLWEKEGNRGEGFVVSASEQTAGLGRLGRQWKSPRGGIWMTLAWPARRPLPEYQAFPLATGHALASYLANVHNLPCEIKWPNDVLVRGRKIAGILLQSEFSPRPPCILAGVGINGNYPAAELGGDLRTPSTTLQEELGAPVDLDAFRHGFLNVLESVLEEYENNGLDNLADSIRERLAWVGEMVHSEDAGAAGVSGRIRGVDAQGRLLLATPEGVRAFVSGEIGRLEPAGRPLA